MSRKSGIPVQATAPPIIPSTPPNFSAGRSRTMSTTSGSSTNVVVSSNLPPLPTGPSSTSASAAAAATAAAAASALAATESRKRTQKKDVALRAKLEKALSKSARGPMQTSNAPVNNAAVSGLRPAPPVIVRETQSVSEAARAMGGLRADAVLVVDQTDVLVGILTDKDIAFRVIAEGKDPDRTVISNVMTPKPSCVTPETSATEALMKMLEGHFRHLPVVDGRRGVVGVLDITRCLYDAMDKMERAYASSKMLYEAMEHVEREWAKNPVDASSNYLESLREKMFCPPLSAALGDEKAVEVTMKTSVREVAKQMKAKKVTAVLVIEDDKLVGIFTSKDIVLRVVAASLDASSTAVIRVMTPNPDTGRPEMTILEALKKMHDGHYLHLPVVDSNNGDIIGMADVLQLTYTTMGQLNSMQGNEDQHVFSNFWNATVDDEDRSSHHNGTTASDARSDGTLEDDDILGSSVTGSDLHRGGGFADSFAYKLTDPNGGYYRFSCATNLADLLEIVRKKTALSISDGVVGGDQPNDYHVAYIDDENDLVRLGTDNDLVEAVALARMQNWSNLRISVYVNTYVPPKKSKQTAQTTIEPVQLPSEIPVPVSIPPPVSIPIPTTPVQPPPAVVAAAAAAPEKGVFELLVDPSYHLRNPAILISTAILIGAIVFVRYNQKD